MVTAADALYGVGGFDHVVSASSFRRASRFAACSFSETSGQLRSSALTFSTRTCATSAWVIRLLSAGMTYHGAQGVDVAVSASSNALV